MMIRVPLYGKRTACSARHLDRERTDSVTKSNHPLCRSRIRYNLRTDDGNSRCRVSDQEVWRLTA